jgi:hypothetical protein
VKKSLVLSLSLFSILGILSSCSRSDYKTITIDSGISLLKGAVDYVDNSYSWTSSHYALLMDTDVVIDDGTSQSHSVVSRSFSYNNSDNTTANYSLLYKVVDESGTSTKSVTQKNGTYLISENGGEAHEKTDQDSYISNFFDFLSYLKRSNEDLLNPATTCLSNVNNQPGKNGLKEYDLKSWGGGSLDFLIRSLETSALNFNEFFLESQVVPTNSIKEVQASIAGNLTQKVECHFETETPSSSSTPAKKTSGSVKMSFVYS